MKYSVDAAQVWCVAVSAAGDFLVSGGADRSLRVWRRTEEPFFVEEERERRLESLFEADTEARVMSTIGQSRNCPQMQGWSLDTTQAFLESLFQAHADKHCSCAMTRAPHPPVQGCIS